MGMPNLNTKEMKAFLKKLEAGEPTVLLSEDAPRIDQLKYSLCKKFVAYTMDHDMSQNDLAKKLRINKSRMSEILNYKIHLYSIDRLIELLEKIDIHVEIVEKKSAA